MAVVEKSGLMKYKDAAGNTTIMYPITNTDNVDGLDEAIAATKPFIVTVIADGGSYTADKTLTEIKAAYDAGRHCCCFFNGDGVAVVLPLFSCMAYTSNGYLIGYAYFMSPVVAGGTVTIKVVEEDGDAGVLYEREAYVLVSDVDTAMSSTSENPVQNKVVAAAIDSAIQSAIQNTWEASY